MTVLLTPSAKQQLFNNAGGLAAGYKLYTYAAGTLTPQATFSDRAGLAQNTNPIVLDARGEAIVYLTPGMVYDYVFKTAADVTVWTREGVTADAGDSNAVAFLQLGAGAVARTVQDKLRDTISVKDFGALGDNVADDTVAFQAALAACSGKELFIPNGSYKLTAGLTVPGATKIRGAGKKNAFLFFTLPSASGAKLMAFNEGGSAAFGGGMCDLSIVDQTPNPATTCVYVENVIEGDFDNIQTTGGRIGFNFNGGDCDMSGCLIGSLAGVMSQTVGVLAENGAGLGVYFCMVQNSTVPANQARFGYIFQSGASPTMKAANTYGCQIGCRLTATGTAMFWPELVDCQFDTASDTGLLIDTGVAGAIYGLSCINLWCGTFDNCGVHIVPGAGTISGAHFNGGRIFGCLGTGIWIEGGTSLTFEGMNISGNGNGNSGGILVSGALNGLTIVGNRIGQSINNGNTQTFGIILQAVAAQNVTIVGNNLAGNISNGLINSSTSSTVKIAANAGYTFPVVAPTLINSWINNGAPTQTAGYWKDAEGVVHLQGLIKGGTLANPAFILPTGFRPTNNEYFACIAQGAFGYAIVDSAGAVIPQAGSNVYFSLCGISFKAV